ncbi:2Fe-2S iron-sulfur cluster binding domain-containing protein [Pseudomaricurvus alkylphenolicus]|uniref:2Fe-2S iron-sulfur cluster-binding protein n=1 Tax=Pseudomaricurvus alkylphenolicus TaxID=1306991 RepID=UPI0014244657|nr:2Fe-2S iron-sulfur cluster-binding protein [Pseudomaricurvus alkylphenolicus]NIB40310.1 2Fe-2S iron-sulfur cluster binding domain-containing protein [Pseudomaricurvus alkylphenolicus]
MPTLNVINLAGEQSSIQAEVGQTLMEALRDNDFDEIEAAYGGGRACAACHVYIYHSWLEKVGARGIEEEMVVSCVDSFQENSRLSCQLALTEQHYGLVLSIANQD